MRIASLIYNGFYYAYPNPKWDSSRSLRAWWLSSFASIPPLLGVLSLIQVVFLHPLFGLPRLPNKGVVVAILVAFALLSMKGDITRKRHTWFGIGSEDLNEQEKTRAKVFAHSYFVGGVLIDWAIAYVLYYPG